MTAQPGEAPATTTDGVAGTDPPEPGTGRRPVAAGLLVLVPVGLTVGLGVWGLDRPSLYGSEADSYWAAHLTLRQLAHLLAHIDAVHGLYYLGLHAWLSFGGGVTWMRVLSLIGAVVAVAGTYAIGRRVAGQAVAVGAAAVLALTPYVEEYAQNGRSYAWVMAAVTGLVLALLRAVERADDRRAWLLYTALVLATGYLHEMTLLLQPAFAITLVLARTPRPVVRRWAASTAIGGVLVLPLVYVSYTEAAAVRYLRPAGWPQVRALMRIDFGLDTWTEYVLLAVAVVGVLPLRRRTGRPGITVGRLALPVLLVPPALLILASHAAHSLYDSRYVLYGTVGAALLVAAGAVRIARGIAVLVRSPARVRAVAAWVAVAAVVGFSAASQWHLQSDIRTVASRGQDYAGAAEFLARSARPGDAYLFLPLSARSVELGYPGDFAGLVDVALYRSPVRAGSFVGSDRNPVRLRAAVAACARVWVIGRYPRGRVVDRAGVERVLRGRFRPTVFGHVTGVDVVLFVRDHTPRAGHPRAG